MSINGNHLPKSFRLKSKIHIHHLFQNGKQIKGKLLALKYLKAEDSTINKVIFVASKRNYKTAVSRNKVKRKLKEVYRTNMQTNHDYSYYLAMIYLGKPDCALSEIDAEYKALLKKIKF